VTQEKPIVSIIVPTRNRPHSLRRCLQSLCDLRSSVPYEVVVVDSCSATPVEPVVREFMGRMEVRLAMASRPGLHVARHTGYRNARGAILSYLDDDVTVGPSWVDAIAQTFCDRRVLLVGGNVLPVFETSPPWWLRQLWEHQECDGTRVIAELSLVDMGTTAREVDPRYVFGCNFSVRRDALVAAGGFHPDAMPPGQLRLRGDGETHVSDFLRRLGAMARFEPKATVHHWVPPERITPEYFEQRAFAQGVTDSYSAIRRARGLPGVAESSWYFVRRWVELSASYRQVIAAKTPEELRLVRLRMRFRRAYWSGFYWHKDEVRQDADLLAWVLRPNYWDDTAS